MLQLFETFSEPGDNCRTLTAANLLLSNRKAAAGFEKPSASSPPRSSEPKTPTTSNCLGCTGAGNCCSSKSGLVQYLAPRSFSTPVKVGCGTGGVAPSGTSETLPPCLNASASHHHAGHASGSGITRRATAARHGQRFGCSATDSVAGVTRLRCSAGETHCELENLEDDASSTGSDSPRTMSPSPPAASKRELVASPRRRPALKKQRVIGSGSHHGTWMTDEEAAAAPGQASLRIRRRSGGLGGGMRRDLQWHSDPASQPHCSPVFNPFLSPGRRKLPASSAATAYRRGEAGTASCSRSRASSRLQRDTDFLSSAVSQSHSASTPCPPSSAVHCENSLLQNYDAPSQSGGEEKVECPRRSRSTDSLSRPRGSSVDLDRASSPSMCACCPCCDGTHSSFLEASPAGNPVMTLQTHSGLSTSEAAPSLSERLKCPQAVDSRPGEEGPSPAGNSSEASRAGAVAATQSGNAAHACITGSDCTTGRTAGGSPRNEHTVEAELSLSGGKQSTAPGSAHSAPSPEPATRRKGTASALETGPLPGNDGFCTLEESKTGE